MWPAWSVVGRGEDDIVVTVRGDVSAGFVEVDGSGRAINDVVGWSRGLA